MDVISVLNTGFVICLAASILFFVISVVLFFVFDIKTIFMIRSGRAQAKTVKEMQEANASTGRLRVGKNTQTSGLKKKKRASESVPVIQPPAAADSKQDTSEIYSSDLYYQDDSQITEQLPVQDSQASDNIGSSETTALIPESETSILSQIDDSSYEEIGVEENSFYFDVIKKIICRDTDEIIR